MQKISRELFSSAQGLQGFARNFGSGVAPIICSTHLTNFFLINIKKDLCLESQTASIGNGIELPTDTGFKRSLGLLTLIIGISFLSSICVTTPKSPYAFIKYIVGLVISKTKRRDEPPLDECVNVGMNDVEDKEPK
jgi:hypothetical protein